MDAHEAVAEAVGVIAAAVRAAAARQPAAVGPIDPAAAQGVVEAASAEAEGVLRALPGFEALAAALVRDTIRARAWEELDRINAARRSEDRLYGTGEKRARRKR